MVDIASSVKIAVRALKVNKMRSALTSLGIIIGVASVIIMLAIGSGASEEISNQISSMGSNLIIVLSGGTSSSGVRMGSGAEPSLNINDAKSIETGCPSVLEVAPILGGVAQVVYANQNWYTQITGTSKDYTNIRDWPISSGRALSEEDVTNETKVCLVGKTVVDNLFGNLDPIGKLIKIRNIPFIIVGTLESKGQSTMGQDQDDMIIIPLSTAQKKLFGATIPGAVKMIIVKAKSKEDLDSAQDEITSLLRQRHRITIRQEDDFTVRNLTETMQMAQQASNVMTILMGSIASVSLLVGGIGIMNIMLVSVTERTKEIGIRMAVGAKPEDIQVQFITEAIIISLFGGIGGIIIGTGISKIVEMFFALPVEISLISIIGSSLFSGFVGIFFGFYPAYKASKLNPIDALRHE